MDGVITSAQGKRRARRRSVSRPVPARASVQAKAIHAADRPDPSQRPSTLANGAEHAQGRRQYRQSGGDVAEDRAARGRPHPSDLHAGAVRGARLPEKSIYGYAKAWSPLLDTPLRGPIYLRSSSRELPDLVASLGGRIQIDLVGHIDSVDARIRNTFETSPTCRLSKFVLTMQGGKKGLLANNTDLCKATPRASVAFDGQNGEVSDSTPLVKVAKCGKKGK